MIEYFKDQFQKIADEYNGEYHVREEIFKGIRFSSLPISYHKLKIPNYENNIIINIEFGGTSVATVNTSISNMNESKFFQLKKRNPFRILFSKNKKSLIAITEIADVKNSIEKLLEETNLESIASKTLFEPNIKFDTNDSTTNIEMMFSMAFENKEKAIKPIIEFYKSLTEYLKM